MPRWIAGPEGDVRWICPAILAMLPRPGARGSAGRGRLTAPAPHARLPPATRAWQVPLVYRALVLAGLLGAVTLVPLVVGSHAMLRPFREADLRIEGDFVVEDDREIGFVARPSSSSTFVTGEGTPWFHVHTGTLGERISRPGTRETTVVDLLTIGCSFSWGFGVENEDTYTSQLSDSVGIEVMNAAMGAYGTTQVLGVLRRAITRRPRIVVYGVIEDHLRRNLSPCAPTLGPTCLAVPFVDFSFARAPYIHSPVFSDSVARLRRFHARISWWRPGLDDVAWAGRAALERTVLAMKRVPRNERGRRAESMKFLLEEMSHLVRGAGASLVVLYMPTFDPSLPVHGPSRELLESVPQRSGVHFLDTAPVIAHHRREHDALPLNADPAGHPNRRGHSLIAAALESSLRQWGLWPSRCLSGPGTWGGCGRAGTSTHSPSSAAER
jgi:hypothetical protein